MPHYFIYEIRNSYRDRLLIAVLKIPSSDILPSDVAQFGNSSTLQPGEPAIAIGNPAGLDFADTVTSGVISATSRTMPVIDDATGNVIGEETVLQTDAAINPGNSGGPLANIEGQVVGINSSKIVAKGFEGMGFAIPISDALPTILQLIEKGYASHPGLNVQIDPRYTAEFASQQGWPEGAYVSKVMFGGPAQEAGILPGDVITKINGKVVKSSLELTHELFKYKPGDKVTVTIFRKSKTLNLTVTLTEIKS